MLLFIFLHVYILLFCKTTKALAWKKALTNIRSEVSKCDLCSNPQWLFVVATGRSGSTTIMNMLNAVPQIFIAGENNGVMESLLDAYRKQYRLRRRLHFEPGFGVGAWYHPTINKKNEMCDIQQFTKDLIGLSQVNPTKRKIIGFKEIRFTVQQLNDMSEHVFPCAKFIVNIRSDTVAQHKSLFQSRKSIQQLSERNNQFLDWAEKHQKQSFVLPLEDFDVTHFNSILRWVGIEGCNYTKVVHANDHGYNFPPKNTTILNNESSCQFL